MDDSNTRANDDSIEAALRTVLERAAKNDVDLGGAWKVTTERDDGEDHWEVQITEVEYGDMTRE